MSLIPNVNLKNEGSTDLVVRTFTGRKLNETIQFPAGGSVSIAVDSTQSLRVTPKPKVKPEKAVPPEPPADNFVHKGGA